MSEAIVAVVQARLATALPAWTDETDNPNPTPNDKLPSYAVAVSYTTSEPVGMGDARHFREGQIEVTIRTMEPATTFGGESKIHTEAQTIGAAIMAAPAYLGGVVWDIEPEGFEADHEPGETRVSQGDLTYSIQTIE